MISEALEKNRVGQNSSEVYESKIVNVKGEVIRLSNLGFDCQPIGNSEWLMRKKSNRANRKLNFLKTYFYFKILPNISSAAV